VFLPIDDHERRLCMHRFENVIRQQDQLFLGWRRVPVDRSVLGALARERELAIHQIFVGRGYLSHGPIGAAGQGVLRSSPAMMQPHRLHANCHFMNAAALYLGFFSDGFVA
jgi:glutamate synthase domain-containing protein 1